MKTRRRKTWVTLMGNCKEWLMAKVIGSVRVVLKAVKSIKLWEVDLDSWTFLEDSDGKVYWNIKRKLTSSQERYERRGFRQDVMSIRKVRKADNLEFLTFYLKLFITFYCLSDFVHSFARLRKFINFFIYIYICLAASLHIQTWRFEINSTGFEVPQTDNMSVHACI